MKKEFKSKTKHGKFLSDYFYFRECGNDHKTAIYNAKICQQFY